MRNSSIVMLIVALVLGAIAVLGVRTLLGAQSGGSAQPAIETTRVVVARAPMEFGTEISPEMLSLIEWPEGNEPVGSFGSVDEILNGERRVALRSIAPGEAILADRISGFGGRAALSQVIADGMRAVSLRINDVTGAAGFILPGDYVDVLLTVNPDRDLRQAETTVILQNVRVLAIDQTANEAQDGAVVARAATLEVDVADGQRIALASTVGTISLALRNVLNAVEGESERVRTIRFSDLTSDQNAEAAPEPVAAAVRAPARPAQISPYTSMVITRELDSSQERVLRDRVPVPLAGAPAELLGGDGGQP